MGDSARKENSRPTPWLARAILVAPLLIEIIVCGAFFVPHLPPDWGGPILVVFFVGVPLAFGIAGGSLAAMSFSNYAKAASALVPISLLFNLVFLFAMCTSNFQMAPNGNP